VQALRGVFLDGVVEGGWVDEDAACAVDSDSVEAEAGEDQAHESLSLVYVSGYPVGGESAVFGLVEEVEDRVYDSVVHLWLFSSLGFVRSLGKAKGMQFRQYGSC
jgi:hypothetical protein